MGLTGAVSDEALLDAVFSEFVDRNVRTVKPCSATESEHVMKYQHDNTVTQTDPRAEYLIEKKKGRCHHWAQLFMDCVEIHRPGICNLKTIQPVEAVMTARFPDAWDTYWGSPLPAYEYVFFVKSWQIDQELLWSPIDLDGVPAQGNDNPISRFTDHVVVTYNDKIYDPSYGTTHDNGWDPWESDALEATGSIYQQVGDVEPSYWVGRHPIVLGERETVNN